MVHLSTEGPGLMLESALLPHYLFLHPLTFHPGEAQNVSLGVEEG